MRKLIPTILGALTPLLVAGFVSAQQGPATLMPTNPAFTTVTTNSIIMDRANRDVWLRRSALKTLTIDTDGAGGALTLVDIKGPISVTGQITGSAAIVAGSGSEFRFPSSSRILDINDGIIKLSDSAGTAFTRLDFGGVSSSYPSISRNAAGLDIRKADNSGYADLQALTLTANGSSAAYVSGQATTSTDGFITSNLTAATNGVPVQISPRSRWCGTAYNSVSTLSETDCFIAEVLPNTIAGATTANFKIGHSLAGGAIAYDLVIFTATSTVAVPNLQVNAGGSLTSASAGKLANVSDGVWQFINNGANGFTRLILGTNDATTNGASWNVNGGTLEAKTGDGSLYTSINMSGAQLTNIITRYNNSVTAGLGVPAILGENISTTQTANFTALTVSPTASAGRWECSAVVVSDSGTNTGTFQVTIDYVNANGITHTADILPIAGAAGTVAATSTDVASKEFFTVPKRFTVDTSNTNIVMKVVITGTVSYKVSPRCSKEA